MTVKMRTLAIIAAVLGGLLVWFWVSYPSYNYGFRLVIEVDTPSGVKSGSSVLNVTWRSQVPIGPRGAVTQIKGEAVFIDLGGGRNVIALLGFGPSGNEDRIGRLAFDAFRRAGRPMDIPTLAKTQGSAPLTGDLIPTFVTFAGLNDPKTARVVRPDEFEQAFGAGVRFRSARIEMTSASATREIEKKIPVLMKKLRQEEEVSRIERLGDPFRVNYGPFERGR
jgi:hypothetical protein